MSSAEPVIAPLVKEDAVRVGAGNYDFSTGPNPLEHKKTAIADDTRDRLNLLKFPV